MSETMPVAMPVAMRGAKPKLCSRCRVRSASTPRTAYCKPCRAAYQREWRARKDGREPLMAEAMPLAGASARVRLRGTPTRAEMRFYGLI